MKFRFEAFFWEISLNDAGSSFQILAPTLEKTLFWRSSLDFLMWKLFDGGRPSSVRMNTISIAEYLSISYIYRALISRHWLDKLSAPSSPQVY